MRETELEYIEFVELEGKHLLHFKPTGDIIGSFINHWEALRAAQAAERALHAIISHLERTGMLNPSSSDGKHVQRAPQLCAKKL